MFSEARVGAISVNMQTSIVYLKKMSVPRDLQIRPHITATVGLWFSSLFDLKNPLESSTWESLLQYPRPCSWPLEAFHDSLLHSAQLTFSLQVSSLVMTLESSPPQLPNLGSSSISRTPATMSPAES